MAKKIDVKKVKVLEWLRKKKGKARQNKTKRIRDFFTKYAIFLFIGSLVILGSLIDQNPSFNGQFLGALVLTIVTLKLL